MSLRRYTFKLYPNAAQESALRDQARMCAILWNALLQMRETYYLRAKQRGDKKTSLTAFDQGKDITALNQAAKSDPALAEWRLMPRGTQERVADMLDLAMKAFFKRAKSGAGRESGYPQYKSVYSIENFHPSFPSSVNIPLREPTKSCWKFEAKAHSAPAGDSEAKCRMEASELPQKGDCFGGSWRFTLRGVAGSIKARGKFPCEPESLKTADVKFYAGAWWLSVCVEIDRARKSGKQKLKVEYDLIDKFATVKGANGQCVPGLSDPFSNGSKGEIPSNIVVMQQSGCGDPASAGDAQGKPCCFAWFKSCGDPASAGDAQDAAEFLQRRPGCGDPASAGDAQEEFAAELRLRGCGDHENAGGDQVIGAGATTGARLTDSIQSDRDRRYKRGSYRWRKEKLRIAKLKAKEARQRKEALHRWTTAIVDRAAEIEIIAPPQRAMRSGKGNEQFPGAEVSTVAALNRHVLGMAPAAAAQMLEYKAKEAGVACAVTRKEDHQAVVGNDLKAAAIANRRAKRAVKRVKKILEAAE